MLTVTFNFVINSNASCRFFTSLLVFVRIFFRPLFNIKSIHTNHTHSLWQTQRIINIKITYFPLSPQQHLVPVTFHSRLNTVCSGIACFFSYAVDPRQEHCVFYAYENGALHLRASIFMREYLKKERHLHCFGSSDNNVCGTRRKMSLNHRVMHIFLFFVRANSVSQLIYNLVFGLKSTERGISD